MKLLVISHKGCWQDSAGTWYATGGFPLQIAAIAALFDETALLTVQKEKLMGGTALPKTIQVILVKEPKGRDTRRFLSVMAQLPYYLACITSHVREADVVHLPLPGDLSLLGMVAALSQKKRVIARYGGSWEATSQTTLMNRVTQALMRRYAGGRNVMLVAGMGAGEPAMGVHWLFNSVITEAELSSVHPDLNVGVHHPLQIAYIGRLSAGKGVDDVIAALGLLKDTCLVSEADIQCTFFGDGARLDALQRRVAQDGLENLAHFVGQYNRAHLLKCLLGMDLCVLPSLSEGFSKARLDAMFCGVPVVTTGVGFGREMIGANGERGWIVAPGNPEGLRKVLLQILEEPLDWCGLRQRCRQYAERFTLEEWSRTIGQRCADQWQMAIVEGKLRPYENVGPL